ncbi:MAG: VWA domain-containing protein [Spirochaetaceae bacterium]|nr:VWA domain-containing protein [Spirochaetaceae bacterium]MCF7947273.1 VWA domain-containing protein [Spirochaetia bacterium]MCF7950166.1 VWA domain-containing protein [Spirochaetaceae bacterium]
MFQEKGSQVELLVTDVIKRKLSYRDTFHLISFGRNAEFEISRPLRDQQSIEEVLARLMLIKPLDQHTDIVEALKFLGDFSKELPLHSNKEILIISDDVHDPPPDSSYLNHAENVNRVESIADYFKRNGWEVDVVIFPPSGDTSNLQTGLLAQLSTLLGSKVVTHQGNPEETALAATGAVEIIYPSGTIHVDKQNFTLPLTFVNHGSVETQVRLTGIEQRGVNLLKSSEPALLPPGERQQINAQLELPQDTVEGLNTVQLVLSIEGAPNAFPLVKEIQLDVSAAAQKTGGGSGSAFNLKYLLIALSIVIFILILLLVRRFIGAVGSKDSERRPTVGTGRPDVPGLSKRAPSERNFADGLGFRKDDDDSSTRLSEASHRSNEKVSPYGSSALSAGKNKLANEAQDTFKSFRNSTKAKGTTELFSGSEESTKGTADKSSSDKDSLSVLGSFAAREKTNRDKIPLSIAERAKSKSPQQKAKRNIGRSSGKEKPGDIGLEMRADFQHNFLGRNTQWFSPGTSYSIGAPGEADFEITSIALEGVIADIRRADDTFTFTPIQEDCFPELRGKPVENCLGRHFRVVSPETGKETGLVFKKYIPPLERINRLLHMTDAPGQPDTDVVD